MQTEFIIKNFRIFDNEGTMVPLRPLTILTGCNNSGKSSIVKALCLLQDFCSQLEADYNDGKKLHLEQYKMDFQKSPNNLMGGFDLVRHRAKDSEKESNIISFDIVVESSWLLQDVILHLEFGALEKEELNNGYLQEYEIKTLDGDIIYKATREGNISMDFSLVKKEFLHFLYGQYATARWQNAIGYRQATMSFPNENDDKEADLINDCINNTWENLSPTSVIMLLEWQVSHCKYPWRDGYSGTAGQILKNVPNYSYAINSPLLGIFTYFPCLDLLKEYKKADLKLKIDEILDSQTKPVCSLDRKIVNLFMDAFDASEAETLHEFISIRENERFFVKDSRRAFLSNHFGYPELDLYVEVNTDLLDEESLPETANWPVVIYAMNTINEAMVENAKSLIQWDDFNTTWRYYNENSLNDYLKNIIEDIFVHLMPGTLSYSPTNIVQPKRLYSLEDNNDFTNTLKRYFDAKRLFETAKDRSGLRGVSNNTDGSYIPCMFINKWMKELGIADHVEIKSHAEGFGVTIHLFESEADTIGMQLVDKGFGVMQLFAVLLKIETAVLEMQADSKSYTYNYAGLNDFFIKHIRKHNQLYPVTVALEEPECHLHPSLQSKFAEMIVDAHKQYGVNFIIESHSEYFIRKLQLSVAHEEIKNTDISLLYVNSKTRPAYVPVISDIGLDNDGTLKNEFGPGFFDEGLRLSKELYKPKSTADEE